nr:glycosyltransferase family 2 protein [Blautia sp.]
RVYHSHNYTCMQQFHRNFDLGVSQAEHPEVFEGVPSEGEGIRLVKKSMAYLLKTGHIWLIPGLFLQSASKYAGYFLGKRYKKLPEKMIRSCTMNPEYWKKNK